MDSREAGPKPAYLRHRAELRGKLLTLVRPADLEIRRRLGQVREVLLAPRDGVLQQVVAGQRDVREAVELLARGRLGGQLARRGLQCGRELFLGLREALPL